MLMSLRKGKYCGFALCQQTRNVECKDLAFKNLKISSKTGQKLSESQKQSTNHVLRC